MEGDTHKTMKFGTILILAFALYGLYCFISKIIQICRELKFKNKKVIDYDKKDDGKSDSAKS